MSLLYKLPPTAYGGDLITLSARPAQGASATLGGRVFLWWSETRGGRGLVGHGLCASVTNTLGRLTCEVEIVTLREQGFGLGKAELAPYRAAPRTSPQSTLADKLYRNAHNKVVPLSHDEEAWLDRVMGLHEIRTA